MKQTIILWLSLLLFSAFATAQNQNCGLDSRWNLLPNAPVQSFPLEVNGYANGQLSNPGQGVCRIEISFLHNAIKDLEIWVRSPAGQEVRLIGPNVDGSALGLGANWRIAFVRLSENPVPHPGGFSGRWTNDQNLNFYTTGGGTYHPFQGNLGDFNTGPVNGTWTVFARNSPTASNINPVGFIYHFRIVFCDESGTACCFAEAGALRNVQDTTLCPGDPYLALQPEARYTLANQPDTASYGYTYVVSRDGLLYALANQPDLRGYPPGNYQICGLSYLKADQARLSALELGVRTLDSLRNDLASPTPSFCGDLTNQCASITIVEPSAVISDPLPLTCDRPRIVLNGSGSSPAPLLTYRWTNASGQLLASTDTLAVTSPGRYRLTVALRGSSCESTQEVDVIGNQVFPQADAGADAVLTCVDLSRSLGGTNSSQGPSFLYEWTTRGGRFESATDGVAAIASGPGQYFLTVVDTTNGCRTIDSLILSENKTPPVADAGAAVNLTCRDAQLMLGGNTTSTGSAFRYQWSSPTGRFLSATDLAQVRIDLPGAYTLIVTDTRNGCQDTAVVNIGLDQARPVADAGVPAEITCSITQRTLGGANTSSGPSFSYEWSTADGNFVSATNIPQPNVDAPGTYQLQVTDTRNGCTAGSSVVISRNTTEPGADAGADPVLSCRAPVAQLGGPGTAQGAAFRYQWTSVNGSFTTATDLARPSVNSAGAYTLRVTDTRNGCSASSTVVVSANQVPPVANAGQSRELNCSENSFRLDGSGSSTGPEYGYLWRAVSGGGPILDESGLDPLIAAPGTYELLVVNIQTGCRDSARVQVSENIRKPIVRITDPALLNCEVRQLRLDGTASDQGPDFTFTWRTTSGGALGNGANSLTPEALGPGRYELTILDTSNGCRDSAAVQVRDTASVINVSIAPPGTLTCSQTSIPLDGSGSSTGPNLTYTWSTSNGRLTGPANSPGTAAGAPGRYRLEIRDTVTRCSVGAEVDVAADGNLPQADAGAGVVLNCKVSEWTLDGRASSPAGNLRYRWTGPCVTAGADSPRPTINCAGTYTLTVERLDNGCTSVDSVLITLDAGQPQAEAGLPDTLNCRDFQIRLNGSGSVQGPSISYRWTGPGLLNGADSLAPLVNRPGWYFLELTDSITGCTGRDSVLIAQDTLAPQSDAGPDRSIDCNNTSVQLGGPNSSTGPAYSYRWTAPSGVITGINTESTLSTRFPGIYILEVTDSRNGCTREDAVTVRLERDPPTTNAGPDRELNCSVRRVVLNGNASASGPDLQYQWSGPCLQGNPAQALVEADCQGLYFLRITNTRTGCVGLDSVLVSESTTGPRAVAADTADLNCNTGNVRLDGSRSQGGIISWWRGTTLLAQATNFLEVRQAGEYRLIVTDNALGCADTARITVRQNCRPTARIAAADSLNCRRPVVRLEAGASSQGPAFQYRWIEPAQGCITAGAGTLTPEIRCAGAYTLIVTNTVVQLSDTAQIIVPIDTASPRAVVAPAPPLTCTNPTVNLDGSASSSGPDYLYFWSNFSGDTISRNNQTIVGRAGTYVLEVVDRRNGCRAVAFTSVVQDGNLPQINFGSDVFPCLQDTFRLQAEVLPAGAAYQYSWTGPGIVTDADQAGVLIDTTGLFVFSVFNPANGCRATDSVRVIPQTCGPCIEILPADTLSCTRDTLRLQARFCSSCTGCQIQWSSEGGGTILEGGSTLTPLIGSAGAYILAVTDSQGFVVRQRITVEGDFQQPALSAGPDRNLSCSQPVLQLGPASPDSGLRYFWRREGEQPPTGGGNPAYQVTTPGAYILEVESIRNGCRAADTIQIGIDTLRPRAEAGPVRELTCTNLRTTLDGSASSLGLQFTYRWTSTGGNVLAGAETLNPVVDQPGLYLLTVLNQANGCSATDTVRVGRANDLPPAPDLPDGLINCLQDSVVLSGSVPAGGNFRFQWCRLEAGGSTSDCAENLTRVVRVPGRYRFEVTDLRSGCSAFEVVTITEERTQPQAEAGQSQELGCGGTGVQLQGSAGPGAAPLSYSWSGPDSAFIDRDTLPTPIVFAPGIYRLQVRHLLSGCIATDSVQVTRDSAAPDLRISQPLPLTCAVRQLRLQSTASTRSGQTAYRWQTLGGRILGAANGPELLIDQPGRYELLVTDPVNGCSSLMVTEVVQDIARPTALIQTPGGDAITCRDTLLTLNGGTSRSGSGRELNFNWIDLRGGQILGNPIDSVVQIAAPGSYQLLVTDSLNQCRDTALIFIRDNRSVPDLRIVAPERLTCQRTEVPLIAQSNAALNLDYTWRDALGNLIAEGVGSIQIRTGGGYQVSVVDTVTGCAAVSFLFIVADTALPVARILRSENLECDRQVVELDGSISSSGTDFAYQWTSSSEGNFRGNTDRPFVLVDAAGTYTLSVINRRNGCRAEAQTIVQQLGQPLLGAALEIEPSACDGDGNGSIRLDSIRGGTPPFLFALDEGRFSSRAVFVQVAPGEHRLRIQDSNGCEWETTAIMPQADSIIVDLGPDRQIRLGDSVALLAIIPGGRFDRLTWSPGEYFPVQGKPEQVVRPMETTTYRVLAELDGCRAFDVVTITVTKERPLFAPTAFSPDGDGVNDRFTLFAGQDVRQIRFLRIFDRWGNLVFQNQNFNPNDPDAGWDGTLDGQPLNPAVFVYYAEVEYLDGWLEARKGDVALIR